MGDLRDATLKFSLWTLKPCLPVAQPFLHSRVFSPPSSKLQSPLMVVTLPCSSMGPMATCSPYSEVPSLSILSIRASLDISPHNYDHIRVFRTYCNQSIVIKMI